MNHSLPEQMYSTEENPAQGISAVKALAIAGAQGQKNLDSKPGKPDNSLEQH